MKILAAFAIATLASVATAQSPDHEEKAEDTSMGLSLAEVRSERGEPRALLRSGSTTIARYDDVTITFENDVAVEESALDPSKRESRAEMLQRVAREKRQVGQRLYQRYRASGEMDRLSVDQQLDFWLDFRRMYPEVDLGSTIGELRSRLEQQRARQQYVEQEARIAYLEDRLDLLQRRYRNGHYGDGPDSYHSGRHRHGYDWTRRDPYHRRDGRDGSRHPSRRHEDIPSNDASGLPVHRTPAGSLQGHDEVFQTPTPVAPIISRP